MKAEWIPISGRRDPGKIVLLFVVIIFTAFARKGLSAQRILPSVKGVLRRSAMVVFIDRSVHYKHRHLIRP